MRKWFITSFSNKQSLFLLRNVLELYKIKTDISLNQKKKTLLQSFETLKLNLPLVTISACHRNMQEALIILL